MAAATSLQALHLCCLDLAAAMEGVAAALERLVEAPSLGIG